MGHKTLIDGTAYEISGGKTLVNGTGYSIDKGKTLVGGTAYEVGFSDEISEIPFEPKSYYADAPILWLSEDELIRISEYIPDMEQLENSTAVVLYDGIVYNFTDAVVNKGLFGEDEFDNYLRVCLCKIDGKVCVYNPDDPYTYTFIVIPENEENPGIYLSYSSFNNACVSYGGASNYDENHSGTIYF